MGSDVLMALHFARPKLFMLVCTFCALIFVFIFNLGGDMSTVLKATVYIAVFSG